MNQALDALLRPIPKHLAPAFDGRQALLDVSWKTFALEQQLLDLAQKTEAGQQIDRAAIKRLFETIRREILRSVPAYPCRRCMKTPDPSCHCEGKRWLSEKETKIPGVVKRICTSPEVSAPTDAQ